MAEHSSQFWPLTGLVLRIEDISLRPVHEADLDGLGNLLPDDVEMNPATPRPFALEEPASRAVALRQEYWSGLGSWAPDKWNLLFAVSLRDELVGVQTLEADDFAVVRTVETASWLAVEHRGHGLGKRARTAVLSLAFDGLGAEVALSEAWFDNTASLGVSRALGYRPNGSVRHRRGSRAAEMPRLRMDAKDWRAAPRATVEIEGLAPCLPWFVAT